MRPLKILVVDDEPSMVRLVARLLTRLGHTATLAASGRHGLASFQLDARIGEAPDLVISDVSMEGGDGPTMIREILKDYPDAKYCFMTGIENVTVLGQKALLKPFTSEQLAAKIAEVMSEEG